EADIGGQKFRVVIVRGGDKGGAKVGTETKEMSKDELAEGKEEGFAGGGGTLVPLKDKQFTLGTIGATKIHNKTAAGVKVSSKGHRDVDLYFDKETYLLVKSETQVKLEGSDQEVTEESFFSEYKEVQGTKQATKFTIKRAGKLHVEGEATEIQLAE